MFDLFKRKKAPPAEENREQFPLSFRLGSTGSDPNLYCDLTKMPHLLVAGSKEEKAGWLNSVLVSLAADKKAEELQLLLLDSRWTEPWQNLPPFPIFWCPWCPMPSRRSAP